MSSTIGVSKPILPTSQVDAQEISVGVSVQTKAPVRAEPAKARDVLDDARFTPELTRAESAPPPTETTSAAKAFSQLAPRVGQRSEVPAAGFLHVTPGLDMRTGTGTAATQVTPATTGPWGVLRQTLTVAQASQLAQRFGVSQNAIEQLHAYFTGFVAPPETFTTFLSDARNGPGLVSPNHGSDNQNREATFFETKCLEGVSPDDPRYAEALSFFAERYHVSNTPAADGGPSTMARLAAYWSEHDESIDGGVVVTQSLDAFLRDPTNGPALNAPASGSNAVSVDQTTTAENFLTTQAQAAAAEEARIAAANAADHIARIQTDMQNQVTQLNRDRVYIAAQRAEIAALQARLNSPALIVASVTVPDPVFAAIRTSLESRLSAELATAQDALRRATDEQSARMATLDQTRQALTAAQQALPAGSDPALLRAGATFDPNAAPTAAETQTINALAENQAAFTFNHAVLHVIQDIQTNSVENGALAFATFGASLAVFDQLNTALNGDCANLQVSIASGWASLAQEEAAGG